MHVRDVNVEGDVVYIPLAQETQDENEDFNFQDNVQEVQNSYGKQILGLMNLFENLEHLPNFNHALTIFINIFDSNHSMQVLGNM